MIIHHAKVVTCNSAVFENGFVQTEADKIIRIGSMADCPVYGTDDLDAQGGYCVPGLIDPHCHVGSGPEATGITEYSETTDPIVPHYDAVDAFYPFDNAIPKCLRRGITTVVGGPGSTTLIGGQLAAFKLNGEFSPKACIKRGCAIKFAVGEAPKITFGARGKQPSSRMGIAAMLRDILAKAQAYMLCKDNQLPFIPDAKCEALIPLLKGEIPAHVHAMREDDIRMFLGLAEQYHLRTIFVHGQQTVRMTEALLRAGAGVIHGPLMFTSRDMESDGISFQNPLITARAGILTSVCTDACPGLGSAQMLPINGAMLIRAGMEPYEALQLFTINAAKTAGIENRVGTLEVGKDADIAVFDDFPLEFTAHTRFVLVDGKKVV